MDSDNAMLRAALWYAELGYPVFPCAAGRKAPLTEHGLLEATTNAAQITAWWTQHPDANLAIRTDGLVVIDIDGAGNAWLADEPAKLAELGAAPLSLTPRVYGSSTIPPGKIAGSPVSVSLMALVVEYLICVRSTPANSAWVWSQPVSSTATLTCCGAGLGGPATLTFSVVAPFAVVLDLDVNIDMVHSWTEDLDITLTSPPGTGPISVLLCNHRGSVPAFGNFNDTYFDDAAAVSIAAGPPAAVPPFAGPVRPESPLAAFNGIDPTGVWTLTINDSLLRRLWLVVARR